MISCGDVTYLADWTSNRINTLWCGYIHSRFIGRKPTIGIVLSTAAVHPKRRNTMYVLIADTTVEVFDEHINSPD